MAESVQRPPLSTIRRFLRVAIVFLFLILGIFVARITNWKLLLSVGGLFVVRDIKIQSEWPLLPDDVEKWISNVHGANMLFMDGSWLVQQLKMNPWVDQATIRKQFPDQL